MKKTSLSILGATGSVGTSALNIVRDAPEDFEVYTLAAHSNVEKLAQAAIEVNARRAVIGDERLFDALKQALSGSNIEVAAGRRAVIESAAIPVDVVLSAVVGAAGLEPTLAAIEAGTKVALANKESLVCAGRLVNAAVKRNGTELLSVDSEHNAVFQVFEKENSRNVEKVIITASGGPFRTWTYEQMRDVTPEMALKHPNWSMGRRITINSATLMNKGFEVIEAFHLFPIEPHQLDVLVHPQSLVHGLVQYDDGSLLAHLSTPDMRTPIAHCLGYPKRRKVELERLDLGSIGALSFEKPDVKRFPMLGLAFEAMKHGDGAGAAVNAADEIAVGAFLDKTIGFLDMAVIVDNVLNTMLQRHGLKQPSSVEEVLEIDSLARRLAHEQVMTKAA
ncbi:1-deoxy-D-xylulose-5-phosphate reductoisomerase [Flexibacterium corallicola]|uniref:1-deoxy-D-xylulose-5-phosphate reductoisomerase n=1 Tax=Flexibacterium corallicola TaxID=3037259 RepID=UPI00286F222D|nr:1-deoxy-D-xylulose-5-phosphate reductoisomerase [Pseudovibrio sp. M1P-2-3]